MPFAGPHISRSLDDTQRIATEWLMSLSRDLPSSKSPEATVVGLSGHLGAGKTAFTKAVAATLGITEEVTSPTFVIMKVYEIPHTTHIQGATQFPWKRLVHIDAYRLEQREELAALEWEKLVADPHNLIMMEWPEQVGMSASDMHQHIYFENRGDTYELRCFFAR